jgi:hypothetical protein
VIEDHVWMPRETYLASLDGNSTYVLRNPRACGFVLNQAATWDVDHCQRPPEDHRWARGWVRGPIERTPF